ncbi:MAG TPA: hypothetical protein VI728_12545 [Syntrophales bacterium]|nr:hypothetical protein [Syntrophales bacterium]
MLLDDLARDGKADSESAVELVVVFFEMKESVKDARADLRVDADPVILHRKQYVILLFLEPGPLVLIPKREVKFLDMSVEEGIKLIVSAGILKPSGESTGDKQTGV